MHHAIRAIRLTRLGIHLVLGILTVSTVFAVSGKRRRQRLVRNWSSKLLRILNVSLSVRGTPPKSQSLLVANHVSWLDIYLINAVCPPRFVAKSEIRSWPAIGWLSEKTGVLFVERGSRLDTGRMNSVIADAIASGDIVAVFPEGTTSDGRSILSFRAPLLEPARSSSLHPAAIRYVTAEGEVDTQVAYAGDTSFGESLWAILGQKKIHAELVFIKAIEVAGKDRKMLARQAESVIAEALDLPMPCRAPGTPGDLRA
jgi:1-acyl-sn-glycerol-3-phosphate acyltransferase